MKNSKSMLKTFYIHRPSKYSITAAVILMLAAVAIVVVIINRGVYFADFHTSQLMQVTVDNSTNVVDRFSNSPYVAHLDRANNIVEFQAIPDSELNKIVSDLKSETGVTGVQVITHTRILPTDINSRLVWGSLAVLAISLIFLYVTIGRNLRSLNSKLTVQMLGLYYVALGVGLVTLFGLISFVSRFYELTDVTMSAILVAFIWGISVIFILCNEAWQQHRAFFNYLPEVLALNRRRLSSINKIAVAVWAVILVLGMIGLGKKFVIDGLMLGVGVGLIGLCLQTLPSFLIRLNTTDVKYYAGMLRSYNSQAAPLYKQQVTQTAEGGEIIKSTRRSGPKGHKPKRRQ